jgi:hypothetical protein
LEADPAIFKNDFIVFLNHQVYDIKILSAFLIIPAVL